MADDAVPEDAFGIRVSLNGDGNTALLGACYVSTSAAANVGSAYVFIRQGTNWNQQAHIPAPDAVTNAYFGMVSLNSDGNTALIGSGGDTTPAGIYAGSAYVFVRTGNIWSQEARLTADDASAADWFGHTVSLSSDGQTALIGAYYADTWGGTDAGSAYVFMRNAGRWSQVAKLTPSDSAAGDTTGCAVSLSGDGRTVLAGQYRGFPELRKAHVFRLPAWSRVVAQPQRTNGVFHVRYAGSPTNVYTIQAASAVTGPWTNFSTLTASTNGLFDFFDSTVAPQRFYRTVP